MSRLMTLAALTAVATLSATTQAEAGRRCGWKPPIVVHPPIVHPHPPIVHPHPPIVHPHPPIVSPRPPIVQPAPTIQPVPTVRPIGFVPTPQPVAPTRSWYFGMSLQITNTAYGRGLQVASITPGSPAALAGLEPGDVLLAAGAVSLQNAFSNEHGVQLLQSAVTGPAPAVTAFVVPTGPSVSLAVLNIRTQQPTYVTVSPQPIGAPPAPAFASPAPVAAAAAAQAF